MPQTSAQSEAFFQNVFRHIALPQATIDRLHRTLRVKKYPPNNFLVRAGDIWKKLYYVEHGLIRMFYTDLQGRDFNKAFFCESQCTWPVAPHDREQGILFSISAVEPTTIIECPFDSLYETLQSIDMWEMFALPFAEMLVAQKFQREHDLLLLTATERFQQLLQTAPHIVQRVPDYHLASFLGITNVSLSRIKRNLLS